VAVYCAARDPRTPRWIRYVALAIAAYALSPIDFIPDFIPIIGYLDDLLLVPLGILIVIRYLPKNVLEDAREKARQRLDRPPAGRYVVFVVIGAWVLMAALGGFLYNSGTPGL